MAQAVWNCIPESTVMSGSVEAFKAVVSEMQFVFHKFDNKYIIGLGVWYLTALSTIFQLYRGYQFYW
jgi:hypothetical protein